MPAVCKTAILKAESFNLFMNTLYFNLKKPIRPSSNIRARLGIPVC